MSLIRQNYRDISRQISQYCEEYDRDPASVRLIAVGKMHPVDKIVDIAEVEHRDFGENYLQEALGKIAYCQQNTVFGSFLNWHFIGHIQSRKCRDLAENFSWIHTVESMKVARKLNEFRSGKPLNICIQVNIDTEESKSGVLVEELPDFAQQVNTMPNLNLRGLMILPKSRSDMLGQRAVFARCRELMQDLNSRGLQLDHLSMGMTNDLEAAIAEGATMVRIGTALFGERPPKQT
ncbi:MAG: YggS family pyridoxal phosphate-dependent enzyme [Acidiferrobacterales bacterium]|nr:YggS family pyridoxal phosphate-dependent enzyme [Acidiferrobacterales bacterium]